MTHLRELAQLRQGQFHLALALRPRGAGRRLSRRGGARRSLASAGTGYGRGNCLATNDLRHNLLSSLTWKWKVVQR